MTNDLMTCQEVCDYLDIKTNNLRQITFRKAHSKNSVGIAPVKDSKIGRLKLYDRADVERYKALRDSRVGK